VTGLDIRPEMFSRAAERADIRHDISIGFAVMYLGILPFSDDTFYVMVGHLFWQCTKRNTILYRLNITV
jgi:ubiquinone/menaquinone biosynthesis C-methylase UbiE